MDVTVHQHPSRTSTARDRNAFIVGALLAGVALVAWSGVRSLEAALTAGLLRLVGVDADSIENGVRLVLDRGPAPGVPEGGFVAGGFRIVTSCSVAVIAAPVLAAAAVVVATGRVPVRRALGGLVVALPLIVLVSQARLVVTGLLIDRYGQDRGFSLGHVLVGSVVSTVGFVLGLAGFLWFVSRKKPTPALGAVADETAVDHEPPEPGESTP